MERGSDFLGPLTFVVFCLPFTELPDYKHRVHSIKDLVRQLPKPNHDTMQALFKHLRK